MRLPHSAKEKGKGEELLHGAEIDRRSFVKGAVGGIGLAAAGKLVGPGAFAGAAAAATPATAPSLDGRLRGITWTGSDSAVGLVGVGTDQVRVLPMTLKDDLLTPKGNEIATLTVGPSPATIGTVPGSENSFLVTKMTVTTVDQYHVSFELNPNVRQFFLDQGLGFDGYQTTGQATYLVQQALPAPILINTSGEVKAKMSSDSIWKAALTHTHYQPISIHTIGKKWIMLLASNGSTSEEVSTLGTILGVELSSADTSIQTIHEIGTVTGHFTSHPEIIELSDTKLAILFEDNDTIHVLGYDLSSRETTRNTFNIAELPQSQRILQHDRITSSGRSKSWIAEIVPGTYALETMGGEVL